MRRRFLILFSFLLFIIAAPALAQNATPNTPDATPQAAPQAADRAEAAAQQAQQAANDAKSFAEEARGDIDLAHTLLDLFQDVTAVVGILIPVVAVALSYFGLNSLKSARTEVTEAREQFQREIEALRTKFDEERRQNAEELQALKEELNRSSADERVKSNQATLSLSLLPLGERQYRVKDFDGAANTYRQALHLDKDNLVIHFRLGYIYTQWNKLDEAKGYLEHALELDPNFAPALANLGHVYRLMAERLPIEDIHRGAMLAQGEQMLRQALDQSPKLVDDDGESWWGSLGGLHRRRNQIDDAIEAYRRASEVTPQSSYPLGNLALLYMQKNDRELMLDAYRRTERLAVRRSQADVSDFWAYADTLVARLAQGKIREAEEIFDLFFASVPPDAADYMEKPLSTLRQLIRVVPEEQAAQIQPFIDQIEVEIEKRVKK
jgi:tetratricopeptide (TPR) repeat protein